MIRRIATLAAGSAIVSMLSFTLAAWRGPVSFSSVNLWDENDESASPAVIRHIPWNDSKMIAIAIPGTIIIRKGDTPEITVSGPETLVNHLIIKDNNLEVDDTHLGKKFLSWSSRHNSATINITSSTLENIVLNGFNALTLQDYDRDSLNLTINGAGSVKGSGHVETVAVTINGAASVNLSAMTIANLDLTMDGAGSVKAGPSDRAHISIDGAGSVKLTQQPKILDKTINGVGNVSVPKQENEEPKASDQNDWTL